VAAAARHAALRITTLKSVDGFMGFLAIVGVCARSTCPTASYARIGA